MASFSYFHRGPVVPQQPHTSVDLGIVRGDGAGVGERTEVFPGCHFHAVTSPKAPTGCPL